MHFLLHHLEWDAKCCQGQLHEMIEAIADYGVGKVPDLDGLPYELYRSMPDLFRYLLASVHTNWQ